MPRLYKDGRYWYADLQVNGRRIRRSLGLTNKVAAETRLARMQLELAQGRDPFAAVAGVSLARLIADYLAYCEGRNRATTVADKRRAFGRLLKAAGDITARALTRDTVEAALALMLPVAANRALTAYVAMFNWAIARGVLERNPARGVVRRPEARRSITLLTPAGLQSYFEWCAAHDQVLHDISVVAYYTGLRRGDILKIHARDVNLERREITVRVAKRRGELILYLPLTAPPFAVLSRLVAARPGGYLFAGRGADHRQDLRKAFQRALKATGLNFRFMEFRHNCATALLEAGVDLATVQEILGHTNPGTTRRYLTITEGRKRAALDKLVLP